MSDLSAYGSSIQALKEQAQSCRDLKANESRLRDINKVASELESEGLMAEEAPMVQAQQQEHLGSAPGKVRVVLRLHQNQTWCLCYHSFVCLFVCLQDEADSNTASPWKTVRLGVQTTANFNSIKVRGSSSLPV
ncbi:spectrin alpha chain, non-erythrocytic 1-like isoform X1 [Nothobranchius furzeri]|uniref:spectrin alpha chain, non-erythrocytic 1-like isoform X1 n=1 Tax=Nothobranchius furzeri TaxID=105023 RepID=UPI003904CE0C